MQTTIRRTPVNKSALWTGRVISALAVLFFIFDGVTKAISVPEVIEASAQLGYSANQTVGIGILLLACTLIYVIPRSAILGAVLLTGYLGGALATHVSNNSGLFPIVFTLIFGVLVWLGLYLRDWRLHELVVWK